MNEQQEQVTFEGWSVLELLGHRRLGGYVREVSLAGAGFLRIDVPDAEGNVIASQFYPPSSVYSLTPCSKEAALAVARTNRPEPVYRWELPSPLQPAQTERFERPGGGRYRSVEPDEPCPGCKADEEDDEVNEF